MTIQIGKYEIELGVRKVRPLVGGMLNEQRELAQTYEQIQRARRGQRRAGKRTPRA